MNKIIIKEGIEVTTNELDLLLREEAQILKREIESGQIPADLEEGLGDWFRTKKAQAAGALKGAGAQLAGGDPEAAKQAGAALSRAKTGLKQLTQLSAGIEKSFADMGLPPEILGPLMNGLRRATTSMGTIIKRQEKQLSGVGLGAAAKGAFGKTWKGAAKGLGRLGKGAAKAAGAIGTAAKAVGSEIKKGYTTEQRRNPNLKSSVVFKRVLKESITKQMKEGR